MSKKMLVESNPHQVRIAVLEDDRLTELFIERERERGIVGNVYKGRITRVLPGMQAAFVDVGLDRDAFLYVGDVRPDPDHLGEPGDWEPLGETGREQAGPSIESLLRRGQELVVQVMKDPLPNKGARISTHVTLPGRCLVLLPTARELAVSRRIEAEDERERLLGVLSTLAPEGPGLIVRTLGEGRSAEELEPDFAFLSRRWAAIRRRAEEGGAPRRLHRELDPALRLVRDIFCADFSALVVEGEAVYERIRDFLQEVQPALLDRLRLAEGSPSLFARHRINEEMEAALKSRVWLKSGGYLVIHPTEALVAIDVNTGRFVGETDLEETILQTNLEAIREVVRQIRLRDLGGIIVLDLIDMADEDNRQRVFAALEEELERDRAKSKMLGISEFGLVELTRKRTRPSLEHQLTQPCPHCHGSGRIKSMATLCLQLRRELLDGLGKRRAGREVVVRLHPEVLDALLDPERAVLEELEATLGEGLHLQADPTLHHEHFEILHGGS